jgi:hypothetical protein
MENGICVEPNCKNKARTEIRNRCRTHFEALKVDGILPPLPRPSLRESFDMNTLRADGCWIWQGPVNGDGYGSIVYRSKRYKAHRLSWELYHSTEAPDIIDHMCRVRLCVRPDHLQAATNKTNGENRNRANTTNRTTGIRGVHQSKTTGRFHAYASSGRKSYFAGSFPTAVEAEAAAVAKRLQLHTNNLADR